MLALQGDPAEIIGGLELEEQPLRLLGGLLRDAEEALRLGEEALLRSDDTLGPGELAAHGSGGGEVFGFGKELVGAGDAAGAGFGDGEEEVAADEKVDAGLAREGGPEQGDHVGVAMLVEVRGGQLGAKGGVPGGVGLDG